MSDKIAQILAPIYYKNIKEHVVSVQIRQKLEREVFLVISHIQQPPKKSYSKGTHSVGRDVGISYIQTRGRGAVLFKLKKSMKGKASVVPLGFICFPIVVLQTSPYFLFFSPSLSTQTLHVVSLDFLTTWWPQCIWISHMTAQDSSRRPRWKL